MSTKLYILFSAVIVSMTMVGLFVATSKLQDNNTTRPISQQVKTASALVKSPSLRPIDNKDQALTILNMWYDLAPEVDTGGVQVDEEDISNSRKLGIRSELLSAIKPGYKIQLPSFIDDNYLLKLDNIEKSTDTEMVIYGELEDNNETYFSTISIMENTMIAVLSTPKGDFDLKMVDDKGVIYKISGDDASSLDSVIDQAGFLE